MQVAAPDLVDGSYRDQLLDWATQHFHFRLRVVLRPEEQKGFAILSQRWIDERIVIWLNLHRRLRKDYAGQQATSETRVCIAMIRLVVRRLTCAEPS